MLSLRIHSPTTQTAEDEPVETQNSSFMSHNLKNLYGKKLSASDGEIGHVRDFYFDDQTWAVRYVVVDTGSWLAERKVLLSPHAFDDLDQPEKSLRVNLTRQQIEQSPSLATLEPVTREYEEAYYTHYGWPTYWQGGGMWGSSPFPVLAAPLPPAPVEPGPADAAPPDSADSHLRSTLAVDGYHLEASDGTMGSICDFVMEPDSWVIRNLVIQTGHWLPGKEVEIPTDKVGRISYDESAFFVNLTREEIDQSPAHQLVPESMTE